MIAASRRSGKPRPAHARSSRGSSSPAKTGTGLSGTRGGFSPAIGSGISSSTASHLKNCCSARYWLLAYAALYRPSSQATHSCTSRFPTSSQPVRFPSPAQVGGGEPLHRLGVGPHRLGGLSLGGQVQAERADLRLEHPCVQRLGLPGTGLGCGHGHPLLARRTTRIAISPEQRHLNRPRERGCSPGNAELSHIATGGCPAPPVAG